MADTIEMLTRRATLAPATADPEARTVEVIWSTGAPVRRRDMAGQYIERLSLAPEAVDLSRLEGASVLDAHRQTAVRDVLGSVRSAAVDGKRGTALIQFSARPEVEPVWQDVLAGILRHVSVGYSVEEWAETTETGARVLSAVRWTPHEISLVPTPADPGAHIRMETEMTETTTTPARREAPKTETRAEANAEIRSIARIAGLDQSWIDSQIDGGADPDTARRAAFEALASRSAPAIRTEQVRVEMGDSQDDPALRARQMNEIMTLQWAHVDLPERALRLPDSKSGAKVVHLGQPAVDLIRDAQPIEGNPWVITGTLPGKRLSDLQPFWQRVRARAGVKDVRIHDLRHTFASTAVASGQGLPMIGKLLGHTQVQTTARYAHLAAEPVRMAADAVAEGLRRSLG